MTEPPAFSSFVDFFLNELPRPLPPSSGRLLALAAHRGCYFPKDCDSVINHCAQLLGVLPNLLKDFINRAITYFFSYNWDQFPLTSPHFHRPRSHLAKAAQDGYSTELKDLKLTFLGMVEERNQLGADSELKKQSTSLDTDTGKGDPQVLILWAGGPAAGKSRLIDLYLQEIKKRHGDKPPGWATIDVDEFNEYHPAYSHWHFEHRDYQAVPAVHPTSSLVTNELIPLMIDRGVNIIVDSTLKDYHKTSYWLSKAIAKQYHIEIQAVFHPPWECVARSLHRAVLTGRFITPSTVITIHRRFIETYHRLQEEYRPSLPTSSTSNQSTVTITPLGTVISLEVASKLTSTASCAKDLMPFEWQEWVTHAYLPSRTALINALRLLPQ